MVEWMPKGTIRNAVQYGDTHEVAHKHQKSSERKIERRTHAVCKTMRDLIQWD